MIKHACPVCKSEKLVEFFQILQVPVHIGVQWPSHEAAKACPKGDIRLVFCETCGFIMNSAFDPALMDYSETYDNSLHFSATFRQYAQSLATRLITEYKIYDKDVIEIGCGKGDFLSLVCELGDNRGIGFDPSFEFERLDNKGSEQTIFIQDFYSEKYAHFQGDLICCRYVFEHINQPIDFLKMIQRTIRNRQNTILYFEVPNVSLILRDLSIWDIIYEHCNYFSTQSLAYVFNLCGFDICELLETYNGQFISVDAKPRNNLAKTNVKQWTNLTQIIEEVSTFKIKYRQLIQKWQTELAELKKENKQIVAWGAGAKGVGFLNMLEVGEQVKYIVDINPHKQGTFVAGTGQEIVPPKFLQQLKPDIVIVMNPIYKEEIITVLENFRLSPKLLYAH